MQYLGLSCIFLVTKQFQEYVDPEQGEEKKKIGTEEEDVVLPLDPNVLTDNLGFPIVVVCTKVGNYQIRTYLEGILCTIFMTMLIS